MLKEVIDTALILESLSATTKFEALDEILVRAVEAGRIGRPKMAAIRKKLREREEMGSTGIGNGVAVPHVKLKSVKVTILVLARSAEGIAYEAVDGRDVHTVFLIIAPTDAAEEHLQLLRWISNLARNRDFRRFVQGSESEPEIRDLLHEMVDV